MSILVSMGPIDMTKEEYLRVGDRVPYAPRGRDYHVCAGQDGALYIFEVWESREAMEAHNERLVPVLRELYGTERIPDAGPPGLAIRDVIVTTSRDEEFVRP